MAHASLLTAFLPPTTLWRGSRTDVRQPPRANALYTAGRAGDTRSVSTKNGDFRPPRVRSDGAGRPLGGARRSCPPPDPALVVVPGHLCPSLNGCDCGGSTRNRN